ncbi:YodC family protein [Hymenobacter daeguensis]
MIDLSEWAPIPTDLSVQINEQRTITEFTPKNDILFMIPFNVGDTVKLKSGGPMMTVAELEGDDVVCVWFEKSQQHKQRFPAATLRKSEPSTGTTIQPIRRPDRHSY